MKSDIDDKGVTFFVREKNDNINKWTAAKCRVSLYCAVAKSVRLGRSVAAGGNWRYVKLCLLINIYHKIYTATADGSS